MSSTAVADEKTIVAQAIQRIGAIATLPEITSKIISTVENPRSTAANLHQIVSHDPALVTRMLKVVNSAFYGLPGQIASVERAIVLLGLNAVKNIAVAASLGQLFRGVKLCEGFTAKDLWTHCIAVAVAARELARLMRLQSTDEAFLAGMIHDIGILVALQTSPERLHEVCESAKANGGDFCAIERQICGVDHQALGAGLAEAWKFPLTCRLVAGNHHQPQNLPEADRLLVGLVYAADTMCCQAGLGFNLTALHQHVEDLDGWGVHIDPAALRTTEESLPELLEDAGAALGAA